MEFFNDCYKKNIQTGKDGMSSIERRGYVCGFLAANKISYYKGGRVDKENNIIIDDKQVSLRLFIVLKEKHYISALFSPNAITCLIETQLSIPVSSNKTHDNIIHWEDLDKFLEFVMTQNNIKL